MNKTISYAVATLMAVAVLESKGAEYSLDQAHTTVGFSIRHMGLVNVKGHFGGFDGSVEYDGSDAASLKVHAVIKATTIDTGNAKRDDHLRNPDFFEVEKYPEIHFHSSRVEQREGKTVLVGNLKIKDVTKEVALDVTVTGPVEDPWGGQRIGVALSGVIARHDFGVGSDGASDKMIGSEVRLEIDVQGVQK